MTRQPLSSRTALITGAGNGIGRATALRLARDGAFVLVNDRDERSGMAHTIEEITQSGGRAQGFVADIAIAAERDAMFADIARHCDAIDILVNNAGISIPANLEAITQEMIERQFAVNVAGTIFVTQHVIARMRSGGAVVNISSSTTTTPTPGSAIYTATKAAIRGLTSVWALELGARGIRVNCVLPGPISPGLIDHYPERVREMAAAASPFKRIGMAEEVAAAIAFLCSDDASWVSGEHMSIHGAAL